MKFIHLNINNQTYFQHFKDAIAYSFDSFKCSFYFLIHAIYPDLFITKGSEEITKLNEKIKEKYNSIKSKADNKVL